MKKKFSDRWLNFIRKSARPLYVILFLIFLYGSFFVGYTVGRKGEITGSDNARVVNVDVGKPKDVDFSLYWEAWNKLKEKTALDLDTEKMVHDSISGLVSSLDDPYTVFFPPEVNKRFREDIAGEFGGIGVEIIQKNGLPTVVAPLSDSPAEKAGIKAGDIITEVEGTKTADITFDETIDKIRGERGTAVKLKIARETAEEPIEVNVTRDIIVVKSMQWDYKEKSGKRILNVKLRQFGDDSDKLFEEVVKEAQKSKPDAMIVDLRNNPGGYLETSVDLASYFIDGGVIVSEKGKGDKTKEYKTTSRAKLKGTKLVVLVNKGSASASEIFAGAIQDRGAGKLIGEKTFGKGSVQELVDLSDGSAVKITVASWYTPKGRQINKEGISPDIEIADNDQTPEDEQLDRAVEYLVAGE